MSSYRRVNFLKRYDRPVITANAATKDGEIVKFSENDFRGCRFDGMTLQGLDFTGSKLEGVSFRHSKLIDVKIDNAKTGITPRSRGFMFFFSYVLAFISGMTITYALDYFFLLIGIGFEENVWANVGISSFFFMVLLFFIGCSIFIGIGTYFSAILFFVVVSSFCIQAIAEEDIASTSILSLACLVGGVSGFFTHAQVVYINEELSAISDAKYLGINVYLLGSTSLIGSLIGAEIAAHSASESSFLYLSLISLSLILIMLSHVLGYRAQEDKQKYTDARKDYFEYSDTPDRSLQEMLREQRQNRRLLNRYIPIRLIPDSILNSLKTCFFKTELSDVSLLGTKLKRTYFVPREIKFPEKLKQVLKERKRNSEDEELVKVEDIEKMDAQILLDNFGCDRDELLSIISRSGIKNLVLMVNPTFGGGFAALGGRQSGGETSVGNSLN